MAGVMTSFLQQKKNLDTTHQQLPTQALLDTRPRGLADAAPSSWAQSHSPTAASGSPRAGSGSPRAASGSPEPLFGDSDGLRAIPRRPGAGVPFAPSSHGTDRLRGQSHGQSHGQPSEQPQPNIRRNPVKPKGNFILHDPDLEALLAFNSSQRELFNAPTVANKQRHVSKDNSPQAANKHAAAAKRGVLRYQEADNSSEAEELQHASVTQWQQRTQKVASDSTHAEADLLTARHNSSEESPIIAGTRAGGAGDLMFTPRQKRAVEEEEVMDLVSPDGGVTDEFEVDLLSQSPAKR